MEKWRGDADRIDLRLHGLIYRTPCRLRTGWRLGLLVRAHGISPEIPAPTSRSATSSVILRYPSTIKLALPLTLINLPVL
jgi:hypothetical protein